MTSTPNKNAAVDFLKKVVANEIAAAFAQHVAPTFRHHNPWFRGDAAALQAGMEENAQQSPAKILEIQHVIGEGDCVAVHSRIQQSRDARAAAVVHIFRFENGRIVELWDVGMEEPAETINEHGLF